MTTILPAHHDQALHHLGAPAITKATLPLTRRLAATVELIEGYSSRARNPAFNEPPSLRITVTIAGVEHVMIRRHLGGLTPANGAPYTGADPATFDLLFNNNLRGRYPEFVALARAIGFRSGKALDDLLFDARESLLTAAGHHAR